jgi:hypothetical protein
VSESTIIVGNNTPFFARLNLFTHGLWCSDQMGCAADLRSKITQRARTYRAMDMLACFMNPDKGTRTAKYQYLYNYMTKFGPLFGSIFPPKVLQVAASSPMQVNYAMGAGAFRVG